MKRPRAAARELGVSFLQARIIIHFPHSAACCTAYEPTVRPAGRLAAAAMADPQDEGKINPDDCVASPLDLMKERRTELLPGHHLRDVHQDVPALRTAQRRRSVSRPANFSYATRLASVGDRTEEHGLKSAALEGFKRSVDRITGIDRPLGVYDICHFTAKARLVAFAVEGYA